MTRNTILLNSLRSIITDFNGIFVRIERKSNTVVIPIACFRNVLIDHIIPW